MQNIWAKPITSNSGCACDGGGRGGTTSGHDGGGDPGRGRGGHFAKFQYQIYLYYSMVTLPSFASKELYIINPMSLFFYMIFQDSNLHSSIALSPTPEPNT